MKPIGIDPPPSRRIVDRYGLFGILYGMAVIFALLVWAGVLLLAEGVRWLYRKATS